MNNPIHSVLSKKLIEFLDKPWAIGLSGGEDSCVLYHALKSSFPQKSILVIHIHHGVQKDSEEWALFAQKLGQNYGDQVVIKKISPLKTDEGSLRSLRYEAFTTVLRTHYPFHQSILFLGHHQQDQKETFLWRALRGSPLDLLLGMSFEKTMHSFKILRPLLSISKKDILKYKEEHRIHHIVDPSNFKNNYYRNHLRNSVFRTLPFEDTLEKTISYLSETTQALEALLRNQGYDWSNSKCLIIKTEPKQSPNILKILIQKWIHGHAHYAPSQHALEDFIEQILRHHSGKLELKEQKYFYEDECLWTLPGSAQPVSEEYLISAEGLHTLAGAFQIQIRPREHVKKCLIRAIRKKEHFFFPGNLDKHRSSESLWKEFQLGPQRRKFYPAIISEKGELYAYGSHLFLSEKQKNELFCDLKIEILD